MDSNDVYEDIPGDIEVAILKEYFQAGFICPDG